MRRCLEQFNSSGFIEKFTVGWQDVSDRFQIPQKLYGRKLEIETMRLAFNRVYRDHKELMLVYGTSGIGKSVLVYEITKHIAEKQAVFISGKFDQFKRNIPYSALIQAFQSLVSQLLSESEQKLAIWRKRLLRALGPNGADYY